MTPAPEEEPAAEDDESAALDGKTFTGGVFDANNITFTAVTGVNAEAIVLFVDTGNAATDALICYIDSATGLPVLPNGGDINVTWSGSGVFSLSTEGATMPRSFVQDPDAVLDYEWNWADPKYPWLGTDTIASYIIAVTPTGLNVDSSTATSTAVTAWLSGGTVGVTYAVTCHIETAAGREDDRTVTVTVQER